MVYYVWFLFVSLGVVLLFTLGLVVLVCCGCLRVCLVVCCFACLFIWVFCVLCGCCLFVACLLELPVCGGFLLMCVCALVCFGSYCCGLMFYNSVVLFFCCLKLC